MLTDARIKESGEAFFFAWTQTALGTPAAFSVIPRGGAVSLRSRSSAGQLS
jgi:hypothetical protein